MKPNFQSFKCSWRHFNDFAVNISSIKDLNYKNSDVEMSRGSDIKHKKFG